jgi:hypothetical protein
MRLLGAIVAGPEKIKSSNHVKNITHDLFEWELYF